MANVIKHYLYFKKLNQSFSLREPIRRKHLKPYDEIRSCLVLFDASDENESQIMFSIVKELQTEGKQVHAIGYVPFKNVPHYCFPKLSYDYLSGSGVKFTGIPKAAFVADLLNEHFDMMIDFFSVHVPPMCYIAALANAGLKISRSRGEDEFFQKVYDLIIEQSDLSNKAFFAETKKTITMLRPNEKTIL